MQTAKSNETGQMPRLIQVFPGRTGHLVGFVHQLMYEYCPDFWRNHNGLKKKQLWWHVFRLCMVG